MNVSFGQIRTSQILRGNRNTAHTGTDCANTSSHSQFSFVCQRRNPIMGANSENKTPSTRQIIKPVFISVLIDLLGFTMILPLFPSLLEFYKSNDEVNDCVFILHLYQIL